MASPKLMTSGKGKSYHFNDSPILQALLLLISTHLALSFSVDAVFEMKTLLLFSSHPKIWIKLTSATKLQRQNQQNKSQLRH